MEGSVKQNVVEGGERQGDEGGPASCEAVDDVREEMLEPIWSELDVFSSGDLNVLLSSDIHDRAAVVEMVPEVHSHVVEQGSRGCKLLKVKEEVAQQGNRNMAEAQVANIVGVPSIYGKLGVQDSREVDPEVENVEAANFTFQEIDVDAQVASSVGVPNTHDSFTVQDSHKTDSEVLDGLGLADILGDFGDQGSISKIEEEVIHDELEEPVEYVNGNVEGVVDRLESYVVDEAGFDIELVAVESVNYSLERTGNIQETFNAREVLQVKEEKIHKEVDQEIVGVKLAEVREMVVKPEVDQVFTVAPVNVVAIENPVKQEIDQVESGTEVDVVTSENPVKQEVDQVEAGSEVNAIAIGNPLKQAVDQVETGAQVYVAAVENPVTQEVDLVEVGAWVNAVAFENPVKQAADQVKAGVQPNVAAIENPVEQEIDQIEAGVQVSSVAKENGIKQEVGREETGAYNGVNIDDAETNSDRALAVVDVQQPKEVPVVISKVLQDGSLSAEGLASKGFLSIDYDESESDEDSDDSSEDDEDEDSDEVSSSAESEEEDASEAKSVRKGKEGKKDSEDTGPPRTKHELDVLPSVPRVTEVLEPHHKSVTVGHILSVLGLTIIVEASGSSNQRILNENSIVWLTESRVPLGIVDEVFGPVKKPFYLVRFNELSEIPEDARTGADVSYVSEFSEFVLKENPSLYRKALDASGLDDEELPSDEDLEFSDDEKEAAARKRAKSKRGIDNRENRPASECNLADGKHAKGQRTDRGRGRGRGGGRSVTVSNAVDSAADFVAGMDLRGSHWHLSRPGSKHQNGRGWNQRRQNSVQNASHQEPLVRGSETGSANEFRSFPQHRESLQTRDGLYFAEQANNHIHPSISAQQSNLAGSVRGIPFNAGDNPVHLQGQGVPRQQPPASFHPYGYNTFSGYDAPFSMPGQGSYYPATGGPQFIQNSGVLNNPSLHPIPYLSMQGQGQSNMICGPGYGFNVLSAQMNYGVPVHHSLGDRQAGGHPSHTGFMAPAPIIGMVLPDYRAQSIPQNSQHQGPTGVGRASNNSQRGLPLVHNHRSFINKKGSQAVLRSAPVHPLSLNITQAVRHAESTNFKQIHLEGKPTDYPDPQHESTK